MDVARPFLAFLDLQDVDRSDTRRELIAGAAVALMAVPQGIAYAVIAGLPPVMAFASAIPSIVGGVPTSAGGVAPERPSAFCFSLRRVKWTTRARRCHPRSMSNCSRAA